MLKEEKLKKEPSKEAQLLSKELLTKAYFITRALVLLTNKYEQENKRYFSAKEILSFQENYLERIMNIDEVDFICQNFDLITCGNGALLNTYTIKATIMGFAGCFKETCEILCKKKEV